MMQTRRILFSVNDYDSDGDLIGKGIFLHFGDTRVKAADTFQEFCEAVKRMRSMIDEIDQNYPEVPRHPYRAPASMAIGAPKCDLPSEDDECAY